MKKDFEFVAHHAGLKLSVIVRDTTVTLRDHKGIVAAGVWDAGHYVRYAQSQLLAIHPALLDEIDGELRLRMTAKGLQERVPPPRRSAVGYGR